VLAPLLPALGAAGDLPSAAPLPCLLALDDKLLPEEDAEVDLPTASGLLRLLLLLCLLLSGLVAGEVEGAREACCAGAAAFPGPADVNMVNTCTIFIR